MKMQVSHRFLAVFVAGCLGVAAVAFPARALAGSAEAKKSSPLLGVLFYLPNRISDIFDVISVGVAPPAIPYIFPSSAHVNAHVTRAFQVGVGNTNGIFLGKGYGRRFTWGLRHHELSIGPITFTEYERFQGGGAESAEVERIGMLLPGDPPFAQGLSDYWAIGAHAGLLVAAVEVDVHPVELLDAVLGLIGFDIVGDDH